MAGPRLTPEAERPRIAMLDAPRHRCVACGTSCTGHWVEVGPEEVPGIEEAARDLGVERPIDADGLRTEAGQCVFLDDDRLCRIHKRFGEARKPLVCRQYPFVAIDTGEAPLRGGIDPGCAHANESWRDGPDVLPEAIRPKTRRIDPSQVGAERALVGLLSRPGQTVAGALHPLCAGIDGGPDLPAGFASRWILRLKEAPLATLAADPATGFALRRVLTALADAVPAWDPDRPPQWPVLGAEDEAWAVETARRTVFLRLAATVPSVQAVALLALGGAVVCGWAAADGRAPFGPLLAGWARVMRWRALWGALVPDPDTLARLARG